MYVTAYLMLAATFAIIWFASKYDPQIDEPIDDESRHAFDDWFKDAYKVTDCHGNVIEEAGDAGAENPKSDPVKDGEIEESPSGSEEEVAKEEVA